MPSSEDNRIIPHQPLHEQQQPQIKVCSSCQSDLVDSTAAIFLPELDALVCTGCREHAFSPRSTLMPSDGRRFPTDVGSNFVSSILREEGSLLLDARRKPENPPFKDTVAMDPIAETDHPTCQNTFPSSSDYPSELTSLTICCNTNNFSDILPHPAFASPPTPTATVPHRQSSPISSPDPLTDITRLRIRSQGHNCLYPGATFQGTQKSGRNSYDVNVTIVVSCMAAFLVRHIASEQCCRTWTLLPPSYAAICAFEG